MLTILKKYTTGWIAQILLVILVVSFMFWGISGVFQGYGQDAVATVGDTKVPVTEFQARYEETLRAYTQALRHRPTSEEAQQLGIPGQVLGMLVTEATVSDVARQMGLGISEEALKKLIAKDPMATNSQGRYSEILLRQNLSSTGMSLDDFVVSKRTQYTRDQIVDAISGDVKAPDAYLLAFTQFSNEQRTIDYGLIRPKPADEVAAPDETTLSAYYEENKEDWRAPEYRAIRYVTLDIADLAHPEDVTDEAIAQRYEDQKARFTTEGRRTIRQVLFDSEEDATAAAAEISAGSTLDEVADARSLQVNNLGDMTREEIVGEAVADAAFALHAGETSGVVNGPFGFVIIEVTDAVEEQITPLDEVADTLRQEIANETAAAEVTSMVNVVEDARAGGASLSDVAQQYDLPITDMQPIDASATTEDGVTVSDLPSDQLVAAAFQSDVGLENDPIRSGRTGYVWYEVTAITAPRLRELAEVRDRVDAAWRDEQRGVAAAEEADKVLERIKAGETLEAVAVDLGLEIGTADGVYRSSTDKLPTDNVAAAFAGPEGYAAVVDGDEPLEKVVLIVKAVDTPSEPAAGSADQVSAQLSRQLTTSLIGLYAAQAQDGRDIRYNQQVLNQILGGSANAALPGG